MLLSHPRQEGSNVSNKILLVAGMGAFAILVVLGTFGDYLRVPVGCKEEPSTEQLYCLTPTKMGWRQADIYARLHGGHLVWIETEEEQTWLSANFGDELYWIGLTDQEEEGEWVWTSGAAAEFTHWYPGEPNNDNDAEHYALTNFGGPGLWNDGTLESPLRGLIEKD